MLSSIIKTTQGANVLSISPFLVIDGNTQNKTSKLAERKTELSLKLWQTCSTQAPPTSVQDFHRLWFWTTTSTQERKARCATCSLAICIRADEKKWVVMHMCMVISCKQIFTSKSPSCTFCKMHILTLRFLGICTWRDKLEKARLDNTRVFLQPTARTSRVPS